jgi:hypothetical protein
MEGVWFNHIVFFFNKKHWAYKEVLHRRAICMQCPYYDKYGAGRKTVLKGLPACYLCGCNIDEKTACLSCECTLVELDRRPKWSALKKPNLSKLEKLIQKEDNDRRNSI